MQKWEDRTIKLDTKGMLGGILDTATFDGLLNQLGNEGWELVATAASCIPLQLGRKDW